MIREKFSEIRNFVSFEVPNYEDPFEDKLQTKWYIAPKCNTKILKLSFSLLNMNDHWRMVI